MCVIIFRYERVFANVRYEITTSRIRKSKINERFGERTRSTRVTRTGARFALAYEQRNPLRYNAWRRTLCRSSDAQ